MPPLPPMPPGSIFPDSPPIKTAYALKTTQRFGAREVLIIEGQQPTVSRHMFITDKPGGGKSLTILGATANQPHLKIPRTFTPTSASSCLFQDNQ
jgi:hypothetical protein